MDNATFSFRLWLRRLSTGLFLCGLYLSLVLTISAQEIGRPEIRTAEHAVSPAVRDLPILTEVPGHRVKPVRLIPQATTTQSDGTESIGNSCRRHDCRTGLCRSGKRRLRLHAECCSSGYERRSGRDAVRAVGQ